MNSIKNLSEMQKHARSLRRTGATAIERNGSKRTIFGCICGASHSTSTDWNGRSAKHVIDWREQHETSCGSMFDRIVSRKPDAWMTVQRDAIYSDDSH